jgi:hypothetical protein
MQFGKSYSTASEAHLRHTLQLSPTARAKLSPYAREIANLSTAGNRFNLSNLTDDFKVHQQVI